MGGEWAILALVTAGLLARIGMLLWAVGTARSKTAASSITRQILDLCVVVLAMWGLGFALLLHGQNGVLGLSPSLLVGIRSPVTGDANPAGPLAYVLVALLASSAAVTGLAERSRFTAVPVTSFVVGGLIVPIAMLWTWHGWLAGLGYVDAAGAGAGHVVAGVVALIASVILRPRMNKYNRDGSANVILGHSVPLTMSGVGVMVVGWVPYVMGLSLLNGMGSFLAPLNVLLAAAAGGAVACLYAWLRFSKIDPILSVMGLMGGLVAISAAGGQVATPAAVLIGAVAGILVPMVTIMLDMRFRVDDAGGAVTVHGVAGAWGLLATGVLLPGSIGERLAQLGIQAVGLVAIAALAAVLALVTMFALKAAGRLRAREADEFDGLDLAEHDVNAYPDFQQTMIKSYHLREA